MSNPAAGAKFVAALVVGVVGAGTFAGVSHDGRGGESPGDPEPIAEAPPPSTTIVESTRPASTTLVQSTQMQSSQQSTQPALPAAPDTTAAPARVRSRGS